MTGAASLPYRPNVGAVLFDRRGQVFVARRADLANAEGAAGGWQLPQGGIDPGEDPRTAVLRELAEEIGTDRAASSASIPSGWSTIYRRIWWVSPGMDATAVSGSAGSRCGSPARTATSGWMPTPIRNSTPGVGPR